MCQYIETIRVTDGSPRNLSYHQQRMDRTLEHLGSQWRCDLSALLAGKTEGQEGVYKARVVYGANGLVTVEFAPYRMHNIQSLQLVSCDDIDYTYKSADRTRLNELKQLRGDADEIIIVKNGLLTDTSYSNIALWNGRKWFTPKHPLLKGTMRQSLIDEGLLTEKDIPAEELKSYLKVSMINAMMPLGMCEIKV